MGRCAGQRQLEGGATRMMRRHLELSAVRQRDLSRQRQPNARSVALGGMEWHEDTVLVAGRDAAAVVGNGQEDALVARLTSDTDAPVRHARGGVEGVAQQIDHGLLEQSRVCVA